KKGLHLTASMLRAAIRKYLQHLEKQKQIAEKNAERLPEGRQTMKDLMRHNARLTNIEVTDRNIRDFEKTARKYNIDFALKKDKAAEKPRYLVFFKARDVDVMTAAFKEYSARTVLKQKKPSVMKKLYLYRQKVNQRQREKTRERDRGQER
ncbi:MAG: PcfB family protein, partial [Lachnospiraceae bacterium]|nr:PcfB family protein [Lachnospiraceae bacterium]